MSADTKGAPSAPLGDSLNFSTTEESSGIVARNLPARLTQSAQLWGLDLCAELPKQLTSDGVEAVTGNYDRVRGFVAEQYAMSSDWDDRWRTGGNVEELKREAHIDPDSLWAGIAKFAKERGQRLARTTSGPA